MADQTPDISPSNVASVLRRVHPILIGVANADGSQHEEAYRLGVQSHRLADALDAQIDQAWKARLDLGTDAAFRSLCQCRQSGLTAREIGLIEVALRAAFFEVAP